MTQSLLSMWRNDPDFLLGKSVEQIVAFAGDGVLKDGNPTSAEIREYLSAVTPEELERYALECLSSSFNNAPYVLQDVVNEIGTRLGFDVEPGRYRGVQNAIGNDGLWMSKGDKDNEPYDIVMELKTTDAFRIDLDTIANYRESLIDTNRCDEDHSSILLIVGRIDTGGLEAQIRGSKHAWDIRVISTDALVRLMHIKQKMNDWATSTQINKLLRPVEYTRIDKIVDLLFLTARDSEEAQVTEDSDPDVTTPKHSVGAFGPSGFDHDAARTRALDLASKSIDCDLKKKGRVFWTGNNGDVRLVCLSSQPYDDAAGHGYWYGFKPGQEVFLDEAKQGYLLLTCGLDDRPLLFPWSDFQQILKGLKTSNKADQRDEVHHWHITLYHAGKSAEMNVPLQGGRKDMSRYFL